MISSKYRHLTDEKFLKQISNDALRSPLIREFVRRMDDLLKEFTGVPVELCAESTGWCPVCKADLSIRVTTNWRTEHIHLELD